FSWLFPLCKSHRSSFLASSGLLVICIVQKNRPKSLRSSYSELIYQSNPIIFTSCHWKSESLKSECP
uniref:Uncharacterized protein n=1 Tax=Coturnix japonica TaxID=93934 RepID=A0A8C2U5D9_COTJA